MSLKEKLSKLDAVEHDAVLAAAWKPLKDTEQLEAMEILLENILSNAPASSGLPSPSTRRKPPTNRLRPSNVTRTFLITSRSHPTNRSFYALWTPHEVVRHRPRPR
jgi:hypothetical protein